MSREQKAMSGESTEKLVHGLDVLLQHDLRRDLREAVYEIAFGSCVIAGNSCKTGLWPPFFACLLQTQSADERERQA